MGSPVRFSIYLTQGNGGLRLIEAARSRGSKASHFLREMALLGSAISELGFFLGPDGEPMRRLASGRVEVLTRAGTDPVAPPASRPAEAQALGASAHPPSPAPPPPARSADPARAERAMEDTPGGGPAVDWDATHLLEKTADFAEW